MQVRALCLTLKLGKAKVPMVVTNHTYDVVVLCSNKRDGWWFWSEVFIYRLSFKKKEKDGTEVIGNICHCKNTSQDYCREQDG